MVRSYITSAFAGALLLGFATAALAVTGEYGNMCSMGLALGKDIQTDCSINAQLQGKTYCFGSKEAMTQFMETLRAISPRLRPTTQRSIQGRISIATSRALRPSAEGLYASNEW